MLYLNFKFVMKNIFGLIGFYSLLLLISCTQEMEDQFIKGEPISKVVIEGQDFESPLQGRTILDFGEGKGSFKWVENDTLGIFPIVNNKQVGYQVAFPLIDFTSDDASTATFTGGGWALVSGTQYVAYYPFAYNNRNLNSINVTYSGQCQNGNDNMDHFGEYDYMYASNTGPADNSVEFSFHHLGTLLVLKLTMPENATLKSVQLISSGQETFTTKGYFNLNEETPSVVATQKSNVITLDLEDIKVNKDDVVTLYVCAAPFELKNESLTIKLLGTESWYQWNREPKTEDYLAETFYTLERDYAPDVIGNIWDGETPDEDLVADENGDYVIKTAQQLAQFAQMVNEGNTFKGKIVLLASNIDLNGNEWTPIGLNQKRFMGTFDGQGYTISNFKITKSDNGAQAALFGDVSSATIQDFTIDNVQILYPENYTSDFYAAAVVSQAYKVTMKDITVKNSTIQGNNKVAAILAHDADGAEMIIENCHVENCIIETKNETDGGNAGGIVGSVNGSENTKSLVNCSVKNTTFNVVNSADAGKRSNGQMVGTVIATAETVLTLENCVLEGNTFNQTGVENYVTPYDGIFVGGARTDVVGTVIINGKSYPVKPAYIGTTGYESLAAALAASSDGDEIVLTAGNHELADATVKANNIIIKGEDKEKVIVNLEKSIYLQDKSVTLKNLTYTVSTGKSYTEQAFAFVHHAKNFNFEDCIIDRLRMNVYASEITDCEFNVTTSNGFDGYALYYYGNDGSKVKVSKSKFNTAGKAIVMYSEDAKAYDLTVEDCEFISSNTSTDKAAIQMHTEYGISGKLTINNSTATGFVDVNGGLWNELNNSTKVSTNKFLKIIDGVYYIGIADVLAKTLTADEENIKVVLTSNIDLPITTLGSQTPGSGEYKLGGESTKAIIIDLNGQKLNITTTYMSAIGAKNDNATFTIKNGSMTSTGNKATTWNIYDLSFANCNYVIEEVSFDKCIAFTNASKTVTMKEIVINETNNLYALWISAKGQTVEIDGLTVNSGRGIKIDEQYVDAPAKVTLKVSNANFTTADKAAIMVKSAAGADITLNNVDITAVAADTENAVWCDEDAAAYSNLITVTGGKLKVEGAVEVAEGVSKNKAGYEISSKAGLEWFANEVNTNNNNFSGITVKLTANIDLNNETWTPIGQTGSTQFKGTFDGQNYTISNLKIDVTSQTGAHYSTGVFGWLNAAIVKNIKVDKAIVKGNHNVGVIAGYLETSGCTIDNCHVSNANVECHVANSDANGDKCGVIVGHAGNTGVVVKDCTATNSTISAGRDAGQVVGAAKEANVTNCSASNVTVTANGEGTGDNIRNEVIGRLL